MTVDDRLALITNSDHREAKKLRRGLEQLGFCVVPEPASIDAFVAELTRRGHRLALLVTLPGEEVNLTEPDEIADAEEGRRHAQVLAAMMNANVHAPIQVTERLIARMATGSRIIHVAPTGSGPGVRMSRRALMARSRVLHRMHAAEGIEVTAVCPTEPGSIDLETTLWIAGGVPLPDSHRAFANRTPVD